jgi:hypothetical protein
VNVFGPLDPRLPPLAERAHEAAPRVLAPLAIRAVAPIAEGETPAPPDAAGRERQGAAVSPVPLGHAPGESTDRVDVSPGARLLAAMQNAGESAGRAARTLSELQAPTSSGTPSLPALPAGPIPAWVPQAIATLQALPGGRREPDGDPPRAEDGEEPEMHAGCLEADLPTLGRVKIEIAVRGNAVDVRFRVEAAAGRRLEDGAEALARALARRGMRLARHQVRHA